MSDKLQKLLNDVNADQQEYINELKEKQHPEAKAIEKLSAELHSIRVAIVMEQERAQKAENANKRYSLYIAIIAGMISSAVSVFLTYLFLR